MHTTKLCTCTLDYAHPLNEFITTHQQSNQHCSLHSLLLSENPHLPRLPCSVAIKLQPPTTQLTLHACQHALHTQHYPLLPSTTFLFTQQTEQDVGIVWRYNSGVIPILFGWCLRVPSLHGFVKTFLWLKVLDVDQTLVYTVAVSWSSWQIRWLPYTTDVQRLTSDTHSGFLMQLECYQNKPINHCMSLSVCL